jgi:nitrite reductase/ring-hydroxylating ferredoxin subunit
MDGTRIADLDELSADDTCLFRVRSTGDDGDAVASGAAALASDEATAASADGIDGDGTTTTPSGGEDDGEGADLREAILLRLGDGGADGNGSGPDGAGGGDGDDADANGVAAWLNYCQHMTHIKLDKGSGAPVRGGEVVCANHGAMFDADSGQCTYGPCEGAYLNDIEVTVADGGVYLVDEDYEYVGDGPLEDDDDRSSSSNVIL